MENSLPLEADPKHAEVARANIARAGLSSLVDARVGPTLQSLSQLRHEGVGAFDLIFIDADKQNNPAYLDWALCFSRVGTIIRGDKSFVKARSSIPTMPIRVFKAFAAFLKFLQRSHGSMRPLCKLLETRDTMDLLWLS
jgi:predicted O-methyltransferase YrrM